MTRRLSIAVVLLLSAAVACAGVSAAAATPTAQVAKRGARGRARACPRGKRRVTVKVRRHGRTVSVKRCVRRRGRARGPVVVNPTPAPAPAPGPTAPPPLFDPPGQRLDGQAAQPFLQRYLVNSRFTDCPAGWGVNGCTVEQRYSHHADTSFYYCRLTSSSGSDIVAPSSYTVQNATVEADGSWAFDEIVPSGGSPSAYEWHITTSGVVTGLYRFNGGPLQQIGPLQYVPGARDCSY